MAATGVDGDVLFDPGLHWPPLILAAIEGPLAVGTSVWLLGLANDASIVARARSVAPWRAAPTARSSSRGSYSSD